MRLLLWVWKALIRLGGGHLEPEEAPAVVHPPGVIPLQPRARTVSRYARGRR